MTASKREQILATITRTLAGTTGVGSRIYRSRVEAFARNESPAIVVEGGRETAAAFSDCKLDWTMDVLVAIYARGAIPDQVADPVWTSVHAKLMADRTIGGLAMDMVPTSVDPQLEAADQPALWMVCTYQVRYRTAITDLTTG
jgi:hypothetical protein